MRQPLEARSPAEAPPAQRMADFTSSAQLSSTLGDASVVEGQSVATFLYARLHNFSALCNALEPEEAASFVNEVRRLLTEP
jgi:class 3 adenylate cyclase